LQTLVKHSQFQGFNIIEPRVNLSSFLVKNTSKFDVVLYS